MDGNTTKTDAAIISPYRKVSPPTREYRATDTVFLLPELMRTHEYKNSFHELIKAKIAVATIPGAASGKVIL